MNKWSYDVLTAFKEHHYKDVVGHEHLVEELVIDDHQVWYLQKGKVKYLLPSAAIDKLPLQVLKTEKLNYKGKVWQKITKVSSVKRLATKTMSFKKLIDSYMDVKHSHPDSFTLMKLLAFAGECSRINARLCSNPAFGKDGVLNVLSLLMDNVEIVTNPTLPKVEYLLYSKMLVLNELSGLNPQEKRDMVHFLLSAGDFRNSYTKRSRASMGTDEEYDISKLSLLIFYNSIRYQASPDDFFDYLFPKAVLDRFLPILVEGLLDTKQFIKDENPYEVMLKNEDFFVELTHNIEYYRKNWYKELHNYAVDESKYKLGARHWNTFYTITRFIDLYSESQDEFDKWVELLYSKIKAYKNQENELDNPFYQYENNPPVSEETIN